MKKKLIALVSVLALSTTVVTSTFAEVADTHSNDVDITVEGGDLSLTTSEIESFGVIDLSNQPKSHSTGFEDTLTVSDLRGSQEGWSLTVSASQFENGDGDLLPLGSITLGGNVDIERVGLGTGVLAESTLSTNTIIDEGAISIANAVQGTGMGVTSLGFDEDALTLVVDPTTAKVGTYESTLTWNLMNAPQ